MKLEPPVPVPVDSILSWGCAGVGGGGVSVNSGPDDDDDILSGKFNSCDMADSTTGGHMHHHLHSHHHLHNGHLDQQPGGSGMMMSGLNGGPTNQSNKATLLSLDGLDGLLLSGATVLTTPTTPGPGPGGGHSFAELKPLALPPFESYGNGGVSGTLSLDGSLNSSGSSHHHQMGNSNGGGTRTILDINLNLYKASSSGNHNLNNSNNNNNNSTTSLNYYSSANGEPVSTTTLVNGLVGVVKAEGLSDYMNTPDIDDIAAIISNAIADSTVASGTGPPGSTGGGGSGGGGGAGGGGGGSGGGGVGGGMGGGGVSNVASVGLGGVESLGPDIRDPWADIDAWIESACQTANYKHEPMLESPASSASSHTSHSSLSSASPAFAHPSALPPMSSLHGGSCNGGGGSTLQALLSQGAATAGSVALAHMSHDPSNNNVKSEPSMDMPLLQRRLTAGRPEPSNGGGSNQPMGTFNSCSMANKDSSSMQLPHTTFLNQVTTSLPHLDSSNSFQPATARRSTAVKSSSGYSSKDLSDLDDPMTGNSNGGGGAPSGGNGGRSKHKNRSTKAKMTTVMTTDGSGKEKPVHRCNICNRGFLNKSNIKVHLRTHTGEKPFKCDACAKAFRQKAHLLKHMQIHKRITRD